MYHEYTQEELRSYCRSNIETLEIWARRLIHEQMLSEYGTDFINVKLNDEFIINKDIRNHVTFMMDKEPDRFKRPVDTLFIDHIIYFLCNQKWYQKLFKSALDYAYPQGRDEAREFLSRLVPVRNSLSHSNPISMHQAEQAICYSHDFVNGLKKYYKDRGEEQVWNVPRIIKATDSLGNVFDNIDDKGSAYTIHDIPQIVRCGDRYTVHVELDPSFDLSEYDIIWKTNSELIEFRNNSKLTYTFSPKDVSTHMYIKCIIVSHKEWHKHQRYDCEIYLHFQVLPPIE